MFQHLKIDIQNKLQKEKSLHFLIKKYRTFYQSLLKYGSLKRIMKIENY